MPTSSNLALDDSSIPQLEPPTYTSDSFLHASNANVCNYVSMKVSNNHSYRLWKRQILCLLNIHNMVALVDETMDRPTASTNEIMTKYDSLLKGWIFGSISEALLTQVVDFGSAKDVWDKLILIYGPTMSSEIVKLSGPNYHIWKTQMLLLMKNYKIDGLVDYTIDGSIVSSKDTLEKRERLLKNWIVDSVSNDLLMDNIHLRPAKDIWDYLKWNYDSTLTSEIVKLSGQHNYHLWRTEMLYLVNSYNIDGVMDDTIDEASSNKLMDQYDSLLRSWIFDSVSQDALLKVNKLSSTKAVWEKLKSIYGPTIGSEIDHDKLKTSETKDFITRRNDKLRRATMEGQWWEVETILKNDTNAAGDVINNDGETLLHIAVGTGHKYFVRKLLKVIEDKEILKRRSLDGSTALHIAAITGNKYAAGLLIEKERSLISIRNREGTLPYVVAYFNNHFDTSVFLFKATNLNPKTQSKVNGLRKDLTDRNLLLDVISTKQYDLALQLLEAYQDLAVKDDAEVLMTLARNFPSGLGYCEAFIYPSLIDIRKRIVNKTSLLFTSVEFFRSGVLTKPVEGVLLVLVTTAILVYQLIIFPIWIVYLAFLILYLLLWKVSTKVVPPIKNIEKRKMEWEKAKEVLKLVCDKIDESDPVGIRYSSYRRPFLEAACQNAYEVVVEILSRSPKASRWTDNSGYNIIHLAVIHRSQKIYNLIHDVIVDRKILSKSQIDSHNNNVLHLAGRLAPSSKLKSRTGAALQLQQELQWREEVKKRVVPTFTTQKNTSGETPGMVFTREHENLVKEGEKWMKATAKSCSITAALITTIVFAAAITVPGGSDQTTGIPLFNKEVAFIAFAVSDAISLCASTTSLLMFLSILTTRFAEQDFLKKLPTQLIFGLCFLLLSTACMMVAFGATLFLVFSHENAWMLAPICGLVCMPITTFVFLQLPLIADLIKSTYLMSIFRTKSNNQRHMMYTNDFRLLVYKLNEYIMG
ncbi:hypothetical protein LXL04_028204 [Taraxacum kok-saghyz]